jgi:hypothetical protein
VGARPSPMTPAAEATPAGQKQQQHGDAVGEGLGLRLGPKLKDGEGGSLGAGLADLIRRVLLMLLKAGIRGSCLAHACRACEEETGAVGAQ